MPSLVGTTARRIETASYERQVEAMKIVEFGPEQTEPIENFGSVAARSVHLGEGRGDAHVYSVEFAAGGHIGEHPAGFGQLFLIVEGAGWVSGEDGRRVELRAGQGAFIARGENHAKGSEVGMKAIMVQVRDLDPAS